jgi:glucan phosphoethanolaminetransferase (alkaline phosphatase superfamily)
MYEGTRFNIFIAVADTGSYCGKPKLQLSRIVKLKCVMHVPQIGLLVLCPVTITFSKTYITQYGVVITSKICQVFASLDASLSGRYFNNLIVYAIVL